MTISEFIKKWSKVQLSERSAAQQHFLDLFDVFGHSTPSDADPNGEWYTFEKGVAKHGGGKGWADVWKKGFFGWEYKGQGRRVRSQTGEANADQPLQRPADVAYRRLDTAVFAAYGWDAAMDDEAILAVLLELNQRRAVTDAR